MIAGRYVPEREVGRGGMGAVWLARDAVLGREVALKRLGRAPGGDAPDLDRAAREARLAARLNHPHVVAVFDLVQDDDEHWLVMEYVEGATLASLIARDGELPPDRAAALLGQAADALASAHAAGIVHRDVKPSNILVTDLDQVKLSDFGIARGATDLSLTQTGLVTGSPAYLAPEVASGSVATGASDVWSLGATLYHALSGRPPYQVGDNLMGALYRIVHDEPPRLADPGWLGPLLEHTMTRQPDLRWSMAKVRDVLLSGPAPAAPGTAAVAAPAPSPPLAEPTPTEVLASVPPEPPSGPPPLDRSRWAVPVVLGSVLGLVLAAIVWMLLADQEPTTTANTPDGQRTSESTPDTPRPTRAGMESFIADYLATAAADPAAGFKMLTQGFQADSGGIEGYRGFWDQVSDAQLISVTASPQTLTVDYQVAYTLADGAQRAPESVSLTLVFDDGTYLIDAEG